MSEQKVIERCGAKAVIRDSLVGALIDCYAKEYENEVDRYIVMIDTMALFGFEFIELPADREQIKRKFEIYEKLGYIDLAGFDLDDDSDFAFWFARKLFITPQDIQTLGAAAKLDPQDVKKVIDLLK